VDDVFARAYGFPIWGETAPPVVRFVMEADQERKTMNLANEWLDETGLTREPGAS